MEISIKWNVCRVCLQEETQSQEGVNPMRNIFKDTKLAKQIYDCSGVSMSPNDSLPEKICKQCFTILKHAVHFRATCRNSDEYLQSIMQKTRSATSLFKLDKRREETLDLVDEVIEEIFEEDEEKGVFVENALEDIVTEKRKWIKSMSEQLLGTKKSKVDTNASKAANNTGLSPISCSKKIPEAENPESDLLNILKKPEDVLEHETHSSASDSSDHLIEEAGGPSSMNSALPEIKDESDYKTTSVCSDADTYILGDDQDTSVLEKASEEDIGDEVEDACEEEVEGNEEEGDEDGEDEPQNDTTCVETETQLVELGELIQDVKPLIVDQILDVSEDDFHPEIKNNSKDEEFFYIIKNDIKREGNPFVDEIDAIEQIDFISMDDETKSEYNVPVMENVEYLVDSLDEQSLTVLAPKKASVNTIKSVKSSKQPLLKRKTPTELNVFVCDVCGNSFTNKNLLNFHMKIHRNEKSFECELCFKRFNAACNLTAHMRIHTGEKPFECQFCGRKFADRSSHLKHERIHTNEKPYKCNTCGKAFSLSTSLKAHEKIHTGEKPYKCEPCLKSFKLPHQLKAHLNTHLHKLFSVEQ